jgi:hypothetical protein
VAVVITVMMVAVVVDAAAGAACGALLLLPTVLPMVLWLLLLLPQRTPHSVAGNPQKSTHGAVAAADSPRTVAWAPVGRRDIHLLLLACA